MCNTMKACKLIPFKPLSICDTELPSISGDEVLIKVWYAGICHTDLHLWEDGYDLGDGRKAKISERPGFKFPVVPGHEISGEVEDLGCNANTNSGLLIKDKVIIYPIIACRTCSSCLRGQEQACLGNTPFIGFDLGGGYAEYVKVPHYKYVCPAPVNLPIELAALLPCSGLTSYSALSKAAKYLEETLNVTEDASVLIIGAGGIGLWAISLSNVIFSPNVKLTVADCQEEKLKKCKEMGVQRTVIWDFDSSEESVIESTLQTCSGRVDVVIDFVGSTLTVNRAASLVKRGGKILLIGLFGGSNPVMLSHMILDSITFQGSKMGSLKDLQDLVKLIDENKIQFPPMTLTSFDDSINNIMTSMKQGKLIGRYIMKVKQD